MSPRRRLGKRTQSLLQECAAIFRLFTADAGHRLVHTQTLSHSALTLSVALLRSRVTIWDSLTQTLHRLGLHPVLQTHILVFAKAQLCIVL